MLLLPTRDIAEYCVNTARTDVYILYCVMTETLDCNTIVDTWRGIAGGIRATSTSTLGPLALALAPYGHFKALALALHIEPLSPELAACPTLLAGNLRCCLSSTMAM